MTQAELAQQFGGTEVGSQPMANSGVPSPYSNNSNTASLAQKFGGSEIGKPMQQNSQPQQSFAQKVGNFLMGSTQAFGKNIGESVQAPKNVKLFNESLKAHSDVTNSLIKAIKAKEALRQDTSHLQEALQVHLQDTPKLEDFVGQDTARRLNETMGQNAEEVIGQGIGSGLEALSGGVLDSGVGALTKSSSFGNKLATGAKIGATYGAVSGGANAMQNEGNVGQVIGQTATGGALGAGLGVGAETLGSGIGKVAGIIDKSNLVNRILPETEARINKQQDWVKKAQENVAKAYKDSLPLTPVQQSKEQNLLNKRGDNVYTTLAKYNINAGNPEEALSKLQNISDRFESATQHAQVNETAYFSADKIKADAFAQINQNIPSETSREIAKAKIEKEIDSLVKSNPKSVVIDDKTGEVKLNSDLVERLRRTGNSWTNFNASDPEKIGKSTGYALSNAVRDRVEADGTFPSYRYANSEWGKVIHAQELLQKIQDSGKKFKVLGGLSGSIARKVLSGVLGYHTGGIGGAVLSELGTEYSARILSNPELRTYFDRKLIEKFGNTKATPKAIMALENEIRNFLDSQSTLKQIPEKSSFVDKSFVSPNGVVGSNINEVSGIDNTLKQENTDAMYGQTKSNQASNAMSIGTNNTGQTIAPITNPNINSSELPISDTIPQQNNNSNGFIKPEILVSGAGLGALGATSQISSKQEYTRPTENLKQTHISPIKLGNILMQLESSGGMDKYSADKGEKKWLTGLTNIAIRELKNSGIKNKVDINNKKDVIDASIKYFNLMQKKHPELSPAEIYVDYYWRGAKTPDIRQKRINDFNKLIK